MPKILLISFYKILFQQIRKEDDKEQLLIFTIEKNNTEKEKLEKKLLQLENDYERTVNDNSEMIKSLNNEVQDLKNKTR